MKTIIGLFTLVICGSLAAEGTSASCLETAITQAELNQCNAADLQTADAELNRVYKKIQVMYADDPAFLQKLKLAQRAWITFRDAQVEMMYPPHPEEPGYYGSVQPMCDSNYRAQLTLERVATLKTWLAGSTEGDMCSGSVKAADLLQEQNQADQ
jgi:uncharacterized protein YecT (DUF1311 family)